MNIIKNVPKLNVMPTGKLWVFFGKPKVGKSTFAASWNKTLMIDLENGTTEILCDVVKPKNLDEFKKILVDPQLKDYDTIVIDTVDVIYAMMEENVIKRLNLQNKTNYSYIGEFSFGLGWASVKNMMRTFVLKDLTNLMRQNKNVILLLHEKSEIVKRKGQEDRTVYNVNLTGQTATVITSLCDVIGRIYIEKDKNMISFSPNADLGGSRIKALAGKRIPASFEIMKKAIESYKGDK